VGGWSTPQPLISAPGKMAKPGHSTPPTLDSSNFSMEKGADATPHVSPTPPSHRSWCRTLLPPARRPPEMGTLQFLHLTHRATGATPSRPVSPCAEGVGLEPGDFNLHL
jgi:hypothetical protein